MLLLIKDNLCDKRFLVLFLLLKQKNLDVYEKLFPFQKASQLSGLPVICQRIKDFWI